MSGDLAQELIDHHGGEVVTATVLTRSGDPYIVIGRLLSAELAPSGWALHLEWAIVITEGDRWSRPTEIVWLAGAVQVVPVDGQTVVRYRDMAQRYRRELEAPKKPESEAI